MTKTPPVPHDGRVPQGSPLPGSTHPAGLLGWARGGAREQPERHGGLSRLPSYLEKRIYSLHDQDKNCSLANCPKERHAHIMSEYTGENQDVSPFPYQDRVAFLRKPMEGTPEAAPGWLNSLLLVHVYNDYLLHREPTDARHDEHVYKCQWTASW